jgi:hypothetical protein
MSVGSILKEKAMCSCKKWAVAALFALFGGLAAAPARAGDPNRLTVVQVPVRLQPGERLNLKVFFECHHENEVGVYDHLSGRRLTVINSHRDGAKEWTSDPNGTGEDQILVLVGWNKEGPPNGKLPWRLSRYKVFAVTAKSAYVGFEDWTDDDFNDAVAVVAIVK